MHQHVADMRYMHTEYGCIQSIRFWKISASYQRPVTPPPRNEKRETRKLSLMHKDIKTCNNIAYADDMVLLSPSAKGLNCLLGICESYAKKHDVVHNTTKSKVMLFPCKTLNVNRKLLMVLDEDQMEQIYEYVYLGHVITPNLNDNLDIARKKRAICIKRICYRGNCLSARQIFRRSCLNRIVVMFIVHIYWRITRSITSRN